MLLNVGERLALLNTLPAEGNFLTMKIIADIRDAVSFSEQDFTKLDFRQKNERLTWDSEKDMGKEVKIGLKGRSIVHDALAKLDKEGKMRPEHLLLCEKFEYTGE